jgi:hypothetical protein
LRVLSPLPGQATRFTFASYGIGLRLTALRGISFSADYARRLKDGRSSDTHGSVERDGGRLHVSASYQF